MKKRDKKRLRKLVGSPVLEELQSCLDSQKFSNFVDSLEPSGQTQDCLFGSQQGKVGGKRKREEELQEIEAILEQRLEEEGYKEEISPTQPQLLSQN